MTIRKSPQLCTQMTAKVCELIFAFITNISLRQSGREARDSKLI